MTLVQLQTGQKFPSVQQENRGYIVSQGSVYVYVCVCVANCYCFNGRKWVWPWTVEEFLSSQLQKNPLMSFFFFFLHFTLLMSLCWGDVYLHLLSHGPLLLIHERRISKWLISLDSRWEKCSSLWSENSRARHAAWNRGKCYYHATSELEDTNLKQTTESTEI